MFERLAHAVLLAVAIAVATAAPALGHAALQASSPEAGARLAVAPARVVLRFDEPVETALATVRVVDARGDPVQDGAPFHAAGDKSSLAVGLRARRGVGGNLTVVFRTVSADGHRTAGGLRFSVGPPTAAASPGVTELLAKEGAGPGNAAGLGVAKAVEHTAIAVGVGVLAILVLVWMPALGQVATEADGWPAASASFALCARRLLAGASVAGYVAATLMLPLQAALLGGDVGHVLATRFGTVWALAGLAWLAVLVVVAGNRGFVPALRAGWLAAAALPVLAVTLLPALSGHASTREPVAVLLVANVAHVMAAGVWVGGLVTLVVALPAAGRRLDVAPRTALFAAVLTRFSTLALAAVCVLVASGILQSLLELGRIADLTGTAFGRDVAVKLGLVVLLVGCGALNRRRHLPSLAAGGSPFVALRRTLAAEVVLGLAALAVSAALAAQQPPSHHRGDLRAARDGGQIESPVGRLVRGP
jgi:copper transport protein